MSCYRPSLVLVSTIAMNHSKSLDIGVSERVSSCKGNENNRKVVSFPIIFFKKHKGSVV